MSIVKLIDEALWAAERGAINLIMAPLEFVLVLDTETRSRLMADFAARPYMVPNIGSCRERYRGALIAVTHDEEAPSFAIYYRVKK